MRYFSRKFSDLHEYSDYLNTAETSKVFREARMKASHKHDEDWSGTPSYEIADEYMTSGDEKNASQLVESYNGVSLAPKAGDRRKDMMHVSGYRPNVPAYLQGLPKTMWRRVKTPVKAKIVNVIYNVSASCGVSTKDMIVAGIKMAYTIIALEKQGYRLNLYASCMMQDGDEIVFPMVRIKSAEQPLNIRKMVYPLVNPSFFRRHAFRFLETMDGVSNGWPWGYGFPITDKSKFERYLKESGTKYDVALTFYDVNRCSSTEDLINRYFNQYNNK